MENSAAASVSLSAEPAIEGFAAHLFLGGELHEIEEGGVGGEDTAGRIGDDETFGQALDHVEGGGAGTARSGHLGGAGGEAQERARGVLLAEQGSSDAGLAATVAELRDEIAGLAGDAQSCEQRFEFAGAGGIEQVDHVLSDDALLRPAEEAGGGRVHLGDRRVAASTTRTGSPASWKSRR